MVTCNTTLEYEEIVEDPLFGKVKFHHIGLIVSAVFAQIAVIISFYLIYRHATHYSKPWQQKHIIRILFMIPVYAVVSFLSYLYYRHAIYFEVLRDCYEAFAIASFFTLLCHYIAESLHEQKEYFRTITPKNWLLPLNWCQRCTGGRDKGMLRIPRSGLTWFNIIWIGVFSYCFIRVFFTTVSVITQAMGRYCEDSLNPAFAHIWVMAFETVSVTVAMYCLIQFYIQLKNDLAQYRPFMKILCIKLVIFFSFWQSLLISFLVSSGALKPSSKIAYPDIMIGMPSMLLCIEMAFFAAMHLWAFSWKEYDITEPRNAGLGADASAYKGGRFGVKALLDAFNPWDIVKASARGFRWLFVGVRKRHEDKSYQPSTKLGRLDTHDTTYNGPTYAGNGEPAIMISEYGGKNHSKYGSAPDDDRTSLLSHTQGNPFDRRDDLSESGSYNPDRLPANPTPSNPFDDPVAEDSAYHGLHAPPPTPPRPVASPEPRLPQQHGPYTTSDGPYSHNGEWDMFGGISSSRKPTGRPER